MGDQETAKIINARPTIFVEAARPDDSGDGLTWATAKKTVNGAKVAAGNGYCLQLAPGSYGGPLDLSGMTDLLVRGSPGAHLTCGGSGAYALYLGDRTTVEGLRLSKTDSGGATFYAVFIHPARDVTLRDCLIEGDEGGIKIVNSALIRIERCAILNAKDNCFWFILWDVIFPAVSMLFRKI